MDISNVGPLSAKFSVIKKSHFITRFFINVILESFRVRIITDGNLV